MAAIFSAIYDFLARNRWLTYVLAAGLALYCIAGISRIRLDNDILSVIPARSSNLRFADRIDELQNNRELFVMIHQTSPADTAFEQLIPAADWLSERLKGSTFFNARLDATRIQFDKKRQDMIFDSVFYNLPLLLDSADLSAYHSPSDSTDIDTILDRNSRLQTGYSGIALSRYIRQDPLHLSAIVFEKLKSFQLVPGLHQVNNYQVSADNRNLVMDLRLYPATADIEHQLIDSLHALQKQFNSLHTGSQLYMFGSLLATDINKSQSIRDAVITGVISVAAMLFLLFYFFRNRRIPFISLVPAVGGFAFALATFGWLKVPLVAMALSSGTVILAMGINYAIHLVNGYLFTGSRREAVAEVVNPLIIGNITTVVAFLVLQQSNSLLLRQYSSLSILSLIMGALLTLVLLPHWMPRSNMHFSTPAWVSSLSRYPFHRNKWLMLFVLLGSVLLYFPARKIRFQGDLGKLNYVPAADRKGLDIISNDLHFDLSRTLITLKGTNLDTVLTRFKKIRMQLVDDNPQLMIPDITAIAPPAADQYRNAAYWKEFWSDSLKSALQQISNARGDVAGAQLNAFLARLSQLDTTGIPERLSLTLREDIAGTFLRTNEAGEFLLEVPVVGIPDNDAAFEGDYLFQRQSFTNQIASDIQNDFNNLLWLSALGVFLLLLIFYGRFELALLAFIPMAVSWIWILGLANLFNIEIHIINLILSTFIFGLCDDYSIFMVDGLTRQYKYGVEQITKDRQIILISVLLTVFSLSALLFGRHPAFHSFAVLAIIGLMVVLLLALTIQPWLYEFFITSRTRRGNMPATFLSYFFSTLTFTVFILLGLILSVLGIVLRFTGLMRLTFVKKIFLKLISWSGRFTVWTYPYGHFTIHNQQYYDPKKPGIFIANHQSHIDLLALPWITSNMVVLTNKWVYNNPVYGLMVRAAGYLPGFQDLNEIMGKARATIDQGISILVFPEGSRSPDNDLRRFHKGAFYLAGELNVPIYPVVLHGFGNLLSKGEQYIKPGFASLHLLPAIQPDDTRWGEDYSKRARNISRFFRQQYAYIRDAEETPEYNFITLTRNYLYKGPALFWYVKIKTIHEGLYRELNQLIGPDDHIVDIGTGYGILPLMLQLSGRRRQIKAFDYDKDKIAVARHLFSLRKYPCLEYYSGDLNNNIEHLIGPADIYILYDVLHYLNPELQRRVLEHCITMMRPGGKIIIREGIVVKDRLKATGIVEFISTRIMGFNKTAGKLYFISDEMIDDICVAHHLHMHVIRKSGSSSDTLFYLSAR